jgi:hypothetical protein
MHDEHDEHDEHEEHHEREELEDRRARLRTDAFGRALGESWVTEGDGIYRYMPEPSSLKAPASPPAEDSPSPDVPEDLEDALAPGRRKGRGGADDEPQTRERVDAPNDAARGRKRSLWRRR